MSKIKSVYDDFYRGEAFINIKDKDVMPSTKYVIGTNICQISFKLFPDVGKLVVFSAIDNLLKGAAGQAVQNMNLMFELKETAGLSLVPINP